MMYYHITERIFQAMTSGHESVFFRSARTSCTTFDHSSYYSINGGKVDLINQLPARASPFLFLTEATSMLQISTMFSTDSHPLNRIKLFVHHHEVKLLKFPGDTCELTKFKPTCAHQSWCNLEQSGRSKLPNWGNSQLFQRYFL